MNLKGMQTHRLLAALGACLAALIVAGPAAARPDDGGGNSNQPAADEKSVAWYLTDEYRPFVLPGSEANAIVNQRQLELAGDKQFQVVPYLSQGILEPEQAWEVIPYLSHGALTESDAANLAAQSGVSRSGIPLSAGIPEPGDPVVPGMPELGVFGASASDVTGPAAQRNTPDGYQPQLADRASDRAIIGSLRDRPDGYQPQLGVADVGGIVADEGFDWQMTGFAASLLAALLVALAITFTRGNRHGYRSA